MKVSQQLCVKVCHCVCVCVCVCGLFGGLGGGKAKDNIWPEKICAQTPGRKLSFKNFCRLKHLGRNVDI